MVDGLVKAVLRQVLAVGRAFTGKPPMAQQEGLGVIPALKSLVKEVELQRLNKSVANQDGSPLEAMTDIKSYRALFGMLLSE